MSPVKHTRAILLLPVMVTVVIPGVITSMSGISELGWYLPGWLNALFIATGSVLFCLGLVLIVTTIRLFATLGKGTLAPWDPTQVLVVRGIYRHVRNPMISGVCDILLGEAVALGSTPLLVWFGLFTLANALFIPLVEEPGLERRFGEAYVRYKRHVPAWIPRLRPWQEPLVEVNDLPG